LKFKINADKLSELLKTMTLKQAALHLQIPYSSIYSFCKKRGIKSDMPSRRSKSAEYKMEVISCYLSGMSQMQIAKKFGLSQTTIAVLLKKHSQNLRTKSEAAKLRDSKMTPDQLRERAAAANAVRHAMAIINTFSF
jgi:transposase